MKKTGIFYGSSTGTTEAVANLIASKLGIAPADVHDAGKLTADLAGSYDVLILGTSTWGYGELQDDWNDAVETLKKMDLSGKTVALFGCGDSESYSDTFCDGMGILYEDLKDSQCKFIGFVPDRDALSGRRSFSHFPAAGSGTARNQYRKAASIPVRAASRIPSPSYHSCRRTNSFRRLPPLLPPATAHVSIYGPIRRTVSTTAWFPSPPRSGETACTGTNGLLTTVRYPDVLAVLKKSRIFASLIAKQGLTKLKRQNESLRNHRKNRRYRKQRFPLGKAYQTQIQSQFEDEAFLVGGGRPLDYPESIRRRNQDY